MRTFRARLVCMAIATVLATMVVAPAAYAVGGNFHYPIGSADTLTAKVTQPYAAYGWVYRGKYHTGIDLAATTSTKVYSTAAGTVVFNGWKTGWGNVIIIKHYFTNTGTIYSQYAHLSKRASLPAGTKVAARQYLGYAGNTGGNWGVHLHFELKRLNAGGSLAGPGYTTTHPDKLVPRFYGATYFIDRY